MKSLPKIGFVISVVFASVHLSFAMHTNETFQNTLFPDTTNNSNVKNRVWFLCVKKKNLLVMFIWQ